jgi:hypothetical protein
MTHILASHDSSILARVSYISFIFCIYSEVSLLHSSFFIFQLLFTISPISRIHDESIHPPRHHICGRSTIYVSPYSPGATAAGPTGRGGRSTSISRSIENRYESLDILGTYSGVYTHHSLFIIHNS